MKLKTLVPWVAVALLMPALSLGQNAPQAHPAKPRTIAAVVSADAKSFLDAKQASWTVSNPEALSGFQNQRVKVKYVISAESNRAQVLSVKPIPAVVQFSASKTDSAFHR
jgi:hypothetical protein